MKKWKNIWSLRNIEVQNSVRTIISFIFEKICKFILNIIWYDWPKYLMCEINLYDVIYNFSGIIFLLIYRYKIWSHNDRYWFDLKFSWMTWFLIEIFSSIYDRKWIIIIILLYIYHIIFLILKYFRYYFFVQIFIFKMKWRDNIRKKNLNDIYDVKNKSIIV